MFNKKYANKHHEMLTFGKLKKKIITTVNCGAGTVFRICYLTIVSIINDMDNAFAETTKHMGIGTRATLTRQIHLHSEHEDNVCT